MIRFLSFTTKKHQHGQNFSVDLNNVCVIRVPGFNLPYTSASNTVSSPDIPALTSASQPTTSTNKPPASPAYPSYSPKPVNIYTGSNQGADPLNPQPVPPYSGFVDPSSSYPYQPNYATQYVNPQYPEYPPRLSVLPGTGNTIGQYKPNNFGYPANYQYAPGDAVGNNYPPQGHYQPFDPRFQTIPAPAYPGMYQRAYERPTMYAPAHPHTYVKPPIPAIGGPSEFSF